MDRSMRKMIMAGLAVMMLASSAAALSGCAGTLQNIGNAITGKPTATVATTVGAAENSFTVAVEAETLWLKSGKATPAQAQTAKNLRSAVYADIVTARDAVASGDSPGVAVALKMFNSALPGFTGYISAGGGT